MEITKKVRHKYLLNDDAVAKPERDQDFKQKITGVIRC
jgi:hypothetical protein